MNPAIAAINAFESNAIIASQARLTAYAAAHVERTATIRTARAVATAQADVMQSAMESWIEVVYSDLRYHVHPLTYAILIPCPWSRTHHRSYGLSECQGRLLACLVQDTVAMLPARRRLCELAGNRWLLNLPAFPTVGDALTWLRGPCQVTAGAVLEGWRKYPQGRRDGQRVGQPTGQGHGLPIGR